MGARGVSKSYKGKLSYSEIQKEFKKLENWAKDYYGHQEGYTGSWNTISGPIENLRDEPFASQQAACDALESETEKWSGKYAYYYETKFDKESTKAKKAQAKISSLNEKIEELQKAAEVLFEELRSFKEQNPNKWIKCPHCESSYKIKYLCFLFEINRYKDEAYIKSKCPACSESVGLVSGLKGTISKIEKHMLKIKGTMSELPEAQRELHKAVTITSGEVNTIIYGLASY